MGSWRMPQQRCRTALLERDVFVPPMPARPAREPQRTTARTARRLVEYRAIVVARFDEHRRVEVTADLVVCTCGGRWPCRVERLAAWLLDWV